MPSIQKFLKVGTPSLTWFSMWIKTWSVCCTRWGRNDVEKWALWFFYVFTNRNNKWTGDWTVFAFCFFPVVTPGRMNFKCIAGHIIPCGFYLYANFMTVFQCDDDIFLMATAPFISHETT